MAARKPKVIVTRKLPDSVETRMRELFDARLNLDDTPMTSEQIAEAVRTADVLVPTVTDEITEDDSAQMLELEESLLAAAAEGSLAESTVSGEGEPADDEAEEGTFSEENVDPEDRDE